MIFLPLYPSNDYGRSIKNDMNEILYDLLRQYESGKMSEAEKNTFEQRLADDPAFATEIAEYAAMNAAIREEGDRRLEADLTVYGKKLMMNMDAQTLSFPARETKVRSISMYSRIIYAAAAVVALLVVVLPLWLMNRPDAPIATSSEELYAANFSIPPAPEARDAKAEAWRNAYAKGNYKATIDELNILLSDPSFLQKSEAYHFLGISLLASGDPEAAIKALDQVSADSYDRESADWYTALALLKLDRTEDARQAFQAIAAQKTHTFARQAKEMLGGMK